MCYCCSLSVQVLLLLLKLFFLSHPLSSLNALSSELYHLIAFCVPCDGIQLTQDGPNNIRANTASALCWFHGSGCAALGFRLLASTLPPTDAYGPPFIEYL